MREAVDSFAYFEVNPVIVDMVEEVVLVDEFLWYVGDLDFDVLWAV